MASFTYDHVKHLQGLGDLELDTADWVIILVTAGTTCDTEKAVTTMSGFTTISRTVATSYADVRVLNANTTFSKDAGNNRSILVPSADTTFTTLGGTVDEEIVGIVIAYDVTPDQLDANMIPYRYIDDGGLPKTTTGQDFVVQWSATAGMLNIS